MTYICVLLSSVHRWTVSNYITNEQVTITNSASRTIGGVFSLKRVTVDDNMLVHGGKTITSSLSVVAFPGLNHAVIECTGSLGGEGQYGIAEVTSKCHDFFFTT